jgi:peroxiredoxin
MTITKSSLLVSIAALACLPHLADALEVGDRVDNFRLLDHKGASQELYYLSDMKAVVLMAHGNDCKHAGDNAAALQQVRGKWQADGAEFLLIDSNLGDTRDSIVQATSKAGIDIPVLLDDTQLIGESLGLAQNGEVLVIDPRNWQLVYRGDAAQSANAVAALMTGSAVSKAKTRVSGCSIKMPELSHQRAHAKISYEKTIAPMLIDNCVTCHRQGGIGPWQMSSYDIVRGFAPMIREVVRTERMPPWHADPHYNVFSNNRSLTKEEVKTLVHWIEAGSPRGKGADPLADLKKTWPEWALGEPDLIVEIPAFNVPATGVVPYQMPSAANPLDHEVWVRAVDFLPGDRSVLHHILASVGTDARGIRDGGDLGNFVPGARPLVEPDDAGMLLKPGTRFFFQMHYTVSGKAATDVSRMGLYFRKEPPKYEMHSMVLANPRLKIPANTKSYTESFTRAVPRDILVYTLLPHAHFRGRASAFYVEYPDGRKETLLSVPKYEFNWQTTYELKTPKFIPAGSKLIHTMTWDNSVLNKANPDPNRIVPWGEQTWDEMLYGVVRYRYVDEVVKTASTTP